MTFDKWWESRGFQYDLTIKARFMDCWDDAQKEAAKRCAKICAQQGTAVTHVVANAIKREFGLDKS